MEVPNSLTKNNSKYQIFFFIKYQIVQITIEKNYPIYIKCSYKIFIRFREEDLVLQRTAVKLNSQLKTLLHGFLAHPKVSFEKYFVYINLLA